MAQVDRATFERLRAQARGDGGDDASWGRDARQGGDSGHGGALARGWHTIAAALRLDEVPRAMLVAVAVLAVVAVVLGAVLAGRIAGGGVLLERAADGGASVSADADEGVAPTEGDAEEAANAQDGAGQASEEVPSIYVHVAGAVVAQGVYALAEGARVVDAVAAAGGFAEGADTEALNLAAVLADGSQVRVPYEGEDAGGGVATGMAGTAASTASSGTVNINTADVTELQRLPGVGEATAEAIVRDRTANGPFASPEDLMRVSGIGEKKFAKMQGMVSV